MSECRDMDRKQELDYLYRRLRHLEDAIRSIEALADMSRKGKDLPSEHLPIPRKPSEEPT